MLHAPVVQAFLLGILAAPPDQLRFEPQEIDARVGEVCYALAIADVDGDHRPDVVAATEDAIVWYANPTWERRTILKGATKPDNVCIQAADVDGDGRVDFAVGTGWGPLGLRGTEELTLVTRPGGSDEWRAVPIAAAPSLHRLRFGKLLGSGKDDLVIAPLQGRGVREPDWGAGAGVQIRVFRIPPKPETDPWPSEVADEGLHTAHGLQAVDLDGDGRDELLVAAWEGVFAVRRDRDGRWTREKIGEGFQEDDAPVKGAGEVRLGRLAGGGKFVATVEPWHGSQVVVYDPPASGSGPWRRRVIDADVAGGHGVWCVDLDGDGSDEIAVAQRDPNHDLSTPPDGSRILVYSPRGGRAETFARFVVDDGGIAAEDLTAADLDADGRVDLIAGGRETHNVRIYWNRPRPAE